jgi:hypothetical protein
MSLYEWLTILISAISTAGTIVSAIMAIAKARSESQTVSRSRSGQAEQYLFLSLISIIAGLLLTAILSRHWWPLENPWWYGSFSLVSLIAGLLAGKWLGIRSMALFIGFVVWLFGFIAMNWYAIDQKGGTLLPWDPHGPLLPWVFILILLLPICGLLSWLGAYLATRKTSVSAV